MPWNMKDYPASMKNLDPLVRKKAIDIANALLNDGYTDDRAIPIATSQAEKWLENASDEEKKEFRKEKNPQKDDPHTKNKNAKKLLTANVQVKFEEDKWIVLSEGAKRASDHFNIKEDAIARAKEIAENKKTGVEVFKKDGSHQKDYDFSE